MEVEILFLPFRLRLSLPQKVQQYFFIQFLLDTYVCKYVKQIQQFQKSSNHQLCEVPQCYHSLVFY